MKVWVCESNEVDEYTWHVIKVVDSFEKAVAWVAEADPDRHYVVSQGAEDYGANYAPTVWKVEAAGDEEHGGACIFDTEAEARAFAAGDALLNGPGRSATVHEVE